MFHLTSLWWSILSFSTNLVRFLNLRISWLHYHCVPSPKFSSVSYILHPLVIRNKCSSNLLSLTHFHWSLSHQSILSLAQTPYCSQNDLPKVDHSNFIQRKSAPPPSRRSIQGLSVWPFGEYSSPLRCPALHPLFNLGRILCVVLMGASSLPASPEVWGQRSSLCYKHPGHRHSHLRLGILP